MSCFFTVINFLERWFLMARTKRFSSCWEQFSVGERDSLSRYWNVFYILQKYNQYFLKDSLWFLPSFIFCFLGGRFSSELFVWKCLISVPIFLNASAVLQLSSYWFNGLRKPLVQSQKSFRTLLVPILKCFHSR
jgi:hypothetical protein